MHNWIGCGLILFKYEEYVVMDILIVWGVGAKVGESVFIYMGDEYNSDVGARDGPVVRAQVA